MSVQQRESASSEALGEVGPGADALLYATASADDGGPAALLPVGSTSALGRLLGQLASLDVRRVRIVTRPEWQPGIETAADGTGLEATVVAASGLAEDLAAAAEAAEAGEGRLVLASADLVAHREALAQVLADSRLGSAALVSESARSDSPETRIRVVRNRVVSAESAFHRVGSPTAFFLGLARIMPRDRRRLGWIVQELGGLPGAAAGSADALPLLLVGLVRTAADVSPVDVRGFVAASPRSRDAAGRIAAELDAVDEDRARLDAAVKTYDGFFATFFVDPYAKYLAPPAARLGLSPNAVTLVSLAVGVAAAASFALGTRPGLVVGALLLLASFYLDVLDGTLARYTRTFSAAGAWLDSVCDRGKEYLVYGGLAVGSVRGFDDDVWLLAGAALALQTVRHLGDVAYVTARRSRERVVQPPLDVAWDKQPAASPAARPTRGFLAAARGSSVPKWLHRIVRFPVGERLLLISVTAAVATPRTTFVALLAWGGLAALYTVAGRVAHDHPATSRAVKAVVG